MPQQHFATDFHLDASTDATAWTTIDAVHESGWGTVPVLFATPITARYLRIVADKPDDGGQRGDQMAISDVAAYAPRLTDLAPHKPAQSQFIDGTQTDIQPGSQPSYTDDGNPATWAQATNRYHWTQQTDLGRAEPVNLVTLLQPGSAFATAFHVDVSLDRATFSTVAQHTNSAAALTGIALEQPVRTRYLRVVADRPDDRGQTGEQTTVGELAAY